VWANTGVVTVPRDQLASISLGLAVQRLRDGQPPVPLTDGQATAQALRLRQAGMSYPQISTVMKIYHGVGGGEEAWRRRLHKAGAPRKRHGIGIASFRRVAA
jgi:hypothetical protein